MTPGNGHQRNAQVLEKLDIYLAQLKEVLRGLDDMVEEAKRVDEQLTVTQENEKGSKDGRNREQ